MHQIGIESSLIKSILAGNKTVEGRLGKPKFLKIKEGDILSIREDFWENGEVTYSHEDALRVKVTQVLYFETFKEMLSSIDFEAAVPSAKTIEEAVDKYAEFYSAEDEAEYGVVAIFFELNN